MNIPPRKEARPDIYAYFLKSGKEIMPTYKCKFPIILEE